MMAQKVIGILVILVILTIFIGGNKSLAQDAYTEIYDFDWIMAPRYHYSWAAYDPAQAAYNPKYINPPEGWKVSLTACGSSAGEHDIIQYSWNIQGDNFSYATTQTDCLLGPSDTRIAPIPFSCLEAPHTCPAYTRPSNEIPLFPSLGKYEVTLTVTLSNGKTESLSKTITLSNIVIASIGDSSASGEGNSYEPGIEWPFTGQQWISDDDDWIDIDCHRSSISGHSLAAMEIEQADPHSAVTFISFACSGAEIMDLEEQIASIRASLCSGNDCGTQNPDVDLLFISAGVNDAQFSKVMESCMVPDWAHGPYNDLSCVKDGSLRAEVNQGIDQTRLRYDWLADLIMRGLEVGEVYLVEYPAHLFVDEQGHWGGCDITFGITDVEARWITDRGLLLNNVLEATTIFNDWYFVDGIDATFEQYGYCADVSWYVSVLDSLEKQEDVQGAVHPNLEGHRAIADQIVRKVLSKKPDSTPAYGLTIIFDSVELVDYNPPAGVDTSSITFRGHLKR